MVERITLRAVEMHPGQLPVSTASVRTLVDQFAARFALVPDDDMVKCGGANQSYLWFTKVRGWNHFSGYLGSKDSGIIRHHC